MKLRWTLAFCLAAAAFAQDIVPGRYIVELTGEPAIVHRERARRRSEIRTEQQSLERVLRTRRVTVRARVDTVANALIVNAPDETSLAGLPGVRRVEAVRRLPPLLTRALLDNHQVPAAWDAIGGMANAGAGVKIGILDSGIDPRHEGFQAPEGMTAPDGFPKASSDENLALTNGKIIVARTFDGELITDKTGHGTGVAMAAAGVQHQSPRGIISGVAPRAWLGIYRVTNNSDRFYHTDDILLGLDAAVADGMDVVNLSFGSVGAFGPTGDSIFEGGTRRATELGLLVVHAGGNTPGAQTVGDAASAVKAITAGANNSTPAPSVIPSAGLPYPARVSSNITLLEPLSSPVVDAESLDGNLRGCKEYSVRLRGRVPLIQRGDCFFSDKLANAALAGAAAAIVYNSPDDANPETLISMAVDATTSIPGLFIGNSNGMKLKDLIRTVEDLTVQLRFPFGPPNSLAEFSSQGPSIGDLGIKPDLVATGTAFYTAGVKAPSSNTCRVCDPTGYVTVQGTSFSAPIAAGAIAVIKGARPGLTSDDYRSLLINSATPMVLSTGSTATVMAAGSGILNLKNAVSSTITAAPVSLSFGAGEGTVNRSRDLTLKNVGSEPATWTLTVDSTNDAKPALSTGTVKSIGPGETAQVQLSFIAAGIPAGASQGFVRVEDAATGAVARIPYWYAVAGGVPASLSVLREPDSANAGSQIELIVRIHDAAGLPLADAKPTVTPVVGGGSVESVTETSRGFANSWLLRLRLGLRGVNTFSIRVGAFTYTYSIMAD